MNSEPHANAIADNLASVKARIRSACERAGRSADDVTLVAVSKTWPLADLLAAVSAGATDLGENYVQESVDKVDAWSGPRPVWHFIGPLQSNKTRAIAERFDWVQTIDRLKIARRLSDQRPESIPPLNVCLQVNISRDPAKSGVTPDEVTELARSVSELPRLRLAGLMAIPALDLPEAELKAQFLQLKSLRDTLITDFPDCQALSMGMSQDFEIAIECGATHVRVGSAIFGQRHR
ncbi:YggS family pyridoxal phosphate-dependent enzyme [Saccharospirillum salsuginis]|uniref:Pyridoxal phosphate homeostasis protein n=1 Tax=Saccharospirillum salsuginis TaxID=418750 RepID=A0A918N7C6_9GAMM|nr:YggS family pyridoxal phosphate-dependent enzyme [Saccharospirillum salsuginis]GGX42974.1 UPF0001 protein YggS [Saccharospirillum salsuginis]